MAKFAPVDCLHMCWLKDRSILYRVDEGGRVVKSVDGSTFISGSEEHCVENRALLEPYMVRQHASRSLDIPDVEALKKQLLTLHVTRAGQRMKGSCKKPQALLDATMDLVQANCHLDAKSLKRLLSYARTRFLKTKLQHSVREPQMQWSLHM